jgi:hypothetical protein
MRKIIHAGNGDAEASSRRHALRAAGFDVIAVPADSDIARLAIDQAADLVIVEPGLSSAALQSTLAALSIPVLDLNLDWEALAERSRGN